MANQGYGSEMMTHGDSFINETTFPIPLLIGDNLLILLVGNIILISIYFYEIYINIMQPKTWITWL